MLLYCPTDTYRPWVASCRYPYPSVKYQKKSRKNTAVKSIQKQPNIKETKQYMNSFNLIQYLPFCFWGADGGVGLLRVLVSINWGRCIPSLSHIFSSSIIPITHAPPIKPTLHPQMRTKCRWHVSYQQRVRTQTMTSRGEPLSGEYVDGAPPARSPIQYYFNPRCLTFSRMQHHISADCTRTFPALLIKLSQSIKIHNRFNRSTTYTGSSRVIPSSNICRAPVIKLINRIAHESSLDVISTSTFFSTCFR